MSKYGVRFGKNLTTDENLDNRLDNLSSEKLYQEYMKAQEDFGRLSMAVDRRRSEGRLIVRKEELPWDTDEEHPGFHAIIAPELGFDIYNFHMFSLFIPPHAELGEYHHHGNAIKYYLAGKATEMIDGKPHDMKAGDMILIPHSTLHGTQNPYDEPVRILAVQQYPGTFLQVPTPFIDKGAQAEGASPSFNSDK